MTMSRSAFLFGIVSTLPVPLLFAAAVFGGPWAWIALFYLTLFAFAMDELIGVVNARAAEAPSEFPAADLLSASLAVAHFGLLAAVIWRFGNSTGLGQTLPLFLAAGLFFGQISNANAHELIHRSHRRLHALGKWVFISLLFGHHTSAHPLVHHRYVATKDDPNSARRGEGYYRFFLRAWTGSFRAGFRAETQKRRGKPLYQHPYVTYLAGAAAMMALAAWIGGLAGVIGLTSLAVFAQSQLLLSDYVQHYGLRRAVINNVPEPVNDGHSWNAPHVFTSFMMFNAPRHSAHHTRPAIRYDALPLPDAAPRLPYSLPVMSVLALIPPVWRRLMDRHLAEWQTEPQALRAA